MLGFSFLFTAVDNGFKAMVGAAQAGLEGVSDIMAKMPRVSLGDVFAGVNMMQLDSISDSLEKITGGSIQLTTGLEATFTSMRKEALPVMARMSNTSGDLNANLAKVTGTAHALNTSASTVAESFQAMDRAGEKATDVLKYLGIGLKDLVKIQETTGFKSEDLTAVIRGLTDSWGFTTEAAGDFINEYTSVAKATKTLDTAFTALPQTLAELDKALQSNMEFQRLSPTEQQKFIKSTLTGTQKLAAAFRRLGKTPEDAQQSATAFTASLLENRESIDKAVAGLGEYGGTLLEAAKAAGFASASELFALDPEQALVKMFELRETLKGQPAQLKRFEEAMGQAVPGLSFLGSSADDVKKIFGTMQAEINKTNVTLKEFAKRSYSDGRTAQDRFELLQDSFETRMKKLGGGVGSFLKLQKKSYDGTLKAFKGFVDDPSWGRLTKRLIAAKSIGVSAFFLPMQASAKQTSQSIAKLSDAMGKGGLLGRLEAIRQFGVAGLFLDLTKATGEKGFAGAMKDANAKATELFGKFQIAKQVLEQLKPGLLLLGGLGAGLFGLAKVAGVLLGPLKMMLGFVLPIGKALLAIGGSLLTIKGLAIGAAAAIAAAFAGLTFAFAMDGDKSGMAEFVRGLIPNIESIRGMINSLDAKAIADSVLGFFVKAREMLFKGLGGVSDLMAYLLFGDKPAGENAELIEAIGDVASTIGSVLVDLLAKVLEIGVEYVMASAVQSFVDIEDLVGGLTKEFMKNWTRDTTDALASIEQAWEDFTDEVLKISNDFNRSLTYVIDGVTETVTNWHESFTDMVLELSNELDRSVDYVVDKSKEFATDVFNYIDKNFIQPAKKLFDPVSEIVQNTLVKPFMGLVNFFKENSFFDLLVDYVLLPILDFSARMGTYIAKAVSAIVVDPIFVAINAAREALATAADYIPGLDATNVAGLDLTKEIEAPEVNGLPSKLRKKIEDLKDDIERERQKRDTDDAKATAASLSTATHTGQLVTLMASLLDEVRKPNVTLGGRTEVRAAQTFTTA